MLRTTEKRLYKVKQGQTVRSVAEAFGVTAYALAAENALKEELYEGQLIYLPSPRPLYTAQAGDTKALLCGGEEEYRKANGTDVLYPGMRVRL